MSKNSIFTTASIFLLILLAIVFLIFNKKSPSIPAPVIQKVEQNLEISSTTPTTSSTSNQYLEFTGPISCGSETDESKRKSCENNFNKALNSSTSDDCLSLVSSSDQINCKKSHFISDVAESGQLSRCNEIQNIDNRNICISQAAYQIATTKKDRSYCEIMIYPDDKKLCLEYFKSAIDTDKDSLSDMEEVAIGTNPENPDSDGDMHLDSDEVQKSFNPCGEGVLPSERPIQGCEKYNK